MPAQWKRLVASAGMAAAMAAPATAMDLGEFEYKNSCVQCHGADGTGGGIMAEFLTVPPPDLTAIAKNNGGVFPVKALYEFIDGTADLGAHGGRNMPIWGQRYTVDAFIAADDDSADFPFDPMEGHERYVRTRILALIDYIASIQAE